MCDDILSALPARRGHFLLESGYHTDLWLTLDAMFVDVKKISPLVAALAGKLRPHAPTAICGPFLGGAFLAQALANALGAKFFYAEPSRTPSAPGLFNAEYQLRPELRRLVRGERVAVVDEIISAGSSVRATIAALTVAGASTAVVGTVLVLGNTALEHFARERVPVETLDRRDFNLWKPDEYPLCQDGAPLEVLR